MDNIEVLGALYGDGSREYFLNNKYHKEEGPAIKYAIGYEEYWLCGVHLLKREHEEIMKNRYYILEKNNYRYHFREGRLHRLDGPAVENKYNEQYWINGKQVKKEDIENLKWDIKGKERELKVSEVIIGNKETELCKI